MSDELMTLKEFLARGRRPSTALVTKGAGRSPTTIRDPPTAYVEALAWCRRRYPERAYWFDRAKLATPAGIPTELGDRTRILGWFNPGEPDAIHIVVRDGRAADAYVDTLVHEAAHAAAAQRHSGRDWVVYDGFERAAEIAGSSAAHEFRLDRIYEARLQRERSA